MDNDNGDEFDNDDNDNGDKSDNDDNDTACDYVGNYEDSDEDDVHDNSADVYPNIAHTDIVYNPPKNHNITSDNKDNDISKTT